MQRVLVAGGAGFLGSHLCAKLLDCGHEVICVDNFYTGKRKNVAHLLSCDRFELYRHDVTMPTYLEVDQIFNLASPASPQHYQRYPVQTIKTNVMGTINLLGLAKRLKIRLLQASTSEVYGDPLQHPQSEAYWGNVNPIGERSCYDEGKRCAETLCYDYRRQYGVDVRVVRIFNTYGPQMSLDDGRVVSNFLAQALRGEPLTIYGDGTQTRSFCFVSDLINGFIKLMNLPSPPAHPVNMGNPTEFTMLELAQEVLRVTGSSSSIVHRPLPADDPKQRRPDITFAKDLLSWQPEVSLSEGLKQSLRYFQQEVSSARQDVEKCDEY
jgi:UDP-glucuronate decarboxylase